MRFALVPVKDLGKAKERLSPILSKSERIMIAHAMLEDVLSALKGSKFLTKRFVVTLDSDAIELANKLEIEIILETKQDSESDSVDFSSKVCKEMGAESVLVIPGDAPLIRPEDIDFILKREKTSPSAILVPSTDELGTNAILRKPPDVFPSRFGHDSFRKHIDEAKKKDIKFNIYDLPRIALDIDEPKDLAIFASKESDTRTYRELENIGIIQKVSKSLN